MTELLERAIARLKALPSSEQDAIAVRLLAELEDEQVWKAQFESTTDKEWDRIAERVRQEISDRHSSQSSSTVKNYGTTSLRFHESLG